VASAAAGTPTRRTDKNVEKPGVELKVIKPGSKGGGHGGHH
jgi:hypothetical protein